MIAEVVIDVLSYATRLESDATQLLCRTWKRYVDGNEQQLPRYTLDISWIHLKQESAQITLHNKNVDKLDEIIVDERSATDVERLSHRLRNCFLENLPISGPSLEYLPFITSAFRCADNCSILQVAVSVPMDLSRYAALLDSFQQKAVRKIRLGLDVEDLRQITDAGFFRTTVLNTVPHITVNVRTQDKFRDASKIRVNVTVQEQELLECTGGHALSQIGTQVGASLRYMLSDVLFELPCCQVFRFWCNFRSPELLQDAVESIIEHFMGLNSSSNMADLIQLKTILEDVAFPRANPQLSAVLTGAFYSERPARMYTLRNSATNEVLSVFQAENHRDGTDFFFKRGAVDAEDADFKNIL